MLTAESQQAFNPQRLFVIMGVAGCGKTSIGEGVAKVMDSNFIDGDDFHPQTNIDKMSTGLPLTDEDRWPWLETVAKALANHKGKAFLGCSALKQEYRDYITKHAGEPVSFIHLSANKELIASRMATRAGHFMPTSLLESQFKTLEVPNSEENAINIDISLSKEEVIINICQILKKETS